MKKPIYSCVIVLCSLLAPAIGNAAYVSWGGNTQAIDPITHTQTAAELYSYSNPLGASYNPTLPGVEPVQDTFISFLYQGPDGLSMFGVFDIPQDLTGGTADMNFTSTGLAGSGLQFVVRDDPGDNSFVWNDATGQASIAVNWFPCCTDGFALGYIDPAIGNWSLTTSFVALTGIDRYRILYSLNGNIESLDISAVDFRSFTYSYSAVPVPAAAWLFGTALLGLLGLRRKTAGS